MSLKQKVPPQPDMTELVNLSREAVQMSREQFNEQLAWAKEQFAKNDATTQKVVDSAMRTQDFQQANAEKDRARYEGKFQPLEDSLAADAASYASPERKDLEVGRAQANVAQQFEAQRQNALRDLEGFGINPGATRFAALDIGARTQQGAAEAAAGNQASQMVDATGRALRSEAVNVGRGYPGQIAGTYNTALQAGTGAVNSNLATTASGSNSMGSPQQYFGLSNQALTGWGNTSNMAYKNTIDAFKANQAASGVAPALGLAGGLISSFVNTGGAIPSALPGSGVPSFPQVGTRPGASQGGAQGAVVPMSADPTGGAIPDGVPAQLTPGEFVMPAEVVRWLGEEKMHKMIAKAHEDKAETEQQTGAIPQMKQAPTQNPTFVSHGGRA